MWHCNWCGALFWEPARDEPGEYDCPGTVHLRCPHCGDDDIEEWKEEPEW